MPIPKYQFTVVWDPRDEYYIATCPAFPGLSAAGNTPVEAVAEAEEALALFIDEYNADGVPLPPAEDVLAYSGQLRLRLPRSLHRQLATQADAEGVSLNTLLVDYLEKAASRTDTLTACREFFSHIAEAVHRSTDDPYAGAVEFYPNPRPQITSSVAFA
jgi:predicted RNase H-like HicB family nuclease